MTSIICFLFYFIFFTVSFSWQFGLKYTEYCFSKSSLNWKTASKKCRWTISCSQWRISTGALIIHLSCWLFFKWTTELDPFWQAPFESSPQNHPFSDSLDLPPPGSLSDCVTGLLLASDFYCIMNPAPHTLLILLNLWPAVAELITFLNCKFKLPLCNPDLKHTKITFWFLHSLSN